MIKTTNNLIKIILSTGFLFFNVLLVNGQVGNDKDCTCPEVAIFDQSVLGLIGEEDYPYFLNISDLKKYSNVQYGGLIGRSAKTYTINTRNKQINLHAKYAKNGKLIKGLLVTKNSPVPLVILLYLIDNHKI